MRLRCADHADRITFLHGGVRGGWLARAAAVIRDYCDNPDSVIITLDADDALIGEDVLDRLASSYAAGADVTVGSMLRTDKPAHYPAEFADPRQRRGGNVWQHLRTFRKRLFDAIPDEHLRLDGGYGDLANDWAFMVPIIELAAQPVYLSDPLYLYEPSGSGKGRERADREAVIARILAKSPLRSGNGNDR